LGLDTPSDTPGAAWELRLYIAGQSPSSLRATQNIEALCEEGLAGRHTLEIIDLLEHPELATEHQIVAIPTLVRTVPPPLCKIIGDLAATENVLAALGLRAVGE